MANHLLCLSLAVLAVCAVPGSAAGHRRLLHGGSHTESEEAAELVDATSFLGQLQMQGISPDQRLKQVLGVGSLNEESINTLLQDVQG